MDLANDLSSPRWQWLEWRRWSWWMQRWKPSTASSQARAETIQGHKIPNMVSIFQLDITVKQGCDKGEVHEKGPYVTTQNYWYIHRRVKCNSVLNICNHPFLALGTSLEERSQLLQNPTFSSTNFYNILTWETTEELPPGTVYDVEYKM